MKHVTGKQRNRLLAVILIGVMIGSLAACGNTAGSGQEDAQTTGALSGAEAGQEAVGTEGAQTPEGTGSAQNDEGQQAENTAAERPEWYSRPLNVIDDKYRTFYEIFVYSFYDSDGDGVGDLQGVIQKLDYLNDGDDATDTDLGINGIWLMPVMQSTTYHKYDTMDYESIDWQYGDMEDFEQLLAACKERDIHVIIDLAMNHSSSKHQWFLQAVQYLKELPEGAEPDAAECPYVEYYHFSREAQSGYVPLDGTDWYYEARFWSEMPDLNLQNEAVRREFEAIADFWLEKGGDGFRLDAVKEFVTGSVEENTEILGWFNDYVKSANPDAYIVCECWTEGSTYAQYYASGVDSMFDFDFADKSGIITNVMNGKTAAASYGKALVSRQELYAGYNPDYIAAPFYTNHDMGRSAGYYAGENSPAQTKMAQALNLLMSGSAFLYYGEELGMKGSGIDENKRAPMYWSKDAEQTGMCDGPEDMEKFDMKFDSLEEQSRDGASIYSYVKDVIRLRNQNPELARGTVTFYEEASGEQLCVISKEYEGSEIVLVFNTSAEPASVDLSRVPAGNGTAADLSVIGELLTGAEKIEKNDTEAVMPAYSVLVLGEE